MKPEERISAARLWAAYNYPYLASALFALRFVADERVSHIAGDEYFRVYISDKASSAWSVDLLGVEMIHQVGHLLRGHASRAREIDLQETDLFRWVDAMDAELNDDLQNIVPNKGATSALNALTDRGWKLAIATNDSELCAMDHVEALKWSHFFTSVKGFDSGHGSKPGPGMVLAAAEECNAIRGVYVMVGDSVHDILAGQAAGAITVAIGQQPAALQLADMQIEELGELIDIVDGL